LSLFSFCALFALCALIPSNFFFAQLLFVSLLIAISIGDFCTLFIPTLLTIGFIPVAFMSAWYNYLPITITQSIVGAIFGYTILWLFSYVYTKRTGIQGIGEGDFDMLALIGAFTGFYGSWAALTIGSAVGSCLGILYYFKKKTLHTSPFPFGPLLAFGAYCYVVYMFIVYP
jgi:leader peptidase (prepilin peptidase)/N-methyltransferase